MNCFETVIYKKFSWIVLIVVLISGISCGGDDGGDGNTVKSIQLLVDYSEVTVGGSVSFSVFGDDGSNITSSSTIYVDNTEISGSNFSSNSAGTFWFYASYNNLKSTTVAVQFVDGELPGFVHKVLIEDFTGTWCGWCPRISYGLEQIDLHTNNAVVVAIHRLGSDPFKYSGDGIEDLDAGQYPTGKINRTKIWPYPESSNTQFVLNLINNKADIGLALNSKRTSNTLEVTVSVATTRNYNQYKLVVYLVEDKLYHNQINYTQYYNGSNPIVGFEHNNVLRAVLTDIYGDIAYPVDNEFSTSYTIGTPTNISNLDNVKIVAFVLDGSGTVLNAQVAKLGENKEFEN